jgi:GNAT superfamily N-acetyltransferase
MPEDEISTLDPGYEIRPYISEQDESFVYGAWIDAVRATGTVYKPIRNGVFFHNFRKTITLLLERGAQVLVAAQIDSPVIFGYVVSEKESVLNDQKSGVFHWVYVKANWRRLGVAARLIEATEIDPNKAYYTIRTKHELSLPAHRTTDKDGKSNWVAIREERMHLAASLEANGRAEGDTLVLVRKWPGLAYNPFLLPSPT